MTPVTLAAITSGRQEGHLSGSRIISISFVAGRHTAVVSADEHGLSFYHSLGKVLFVDASDTIRIFGNYHGEDAPEASISGHPNRTHSIALPFAAEGDHTIQSWQ